MLVGYCDTTTWNGERICSHMPLVRVQQLRHSGRYASSTVLSHLELHVCVWKIAATESVF